MFGRHRRQYTKHIARTLNYILNNPKCFDLTQLCVVKGHHCWLVHVDISVRINDHRNESMTFSFSHRSFVMKEIFMMHVHWQSKRHSVKQSNNENSSEMINVTVFL